MKTFEIWWRDLTESAQKEYLEFFGLSEGEMNDHTVIATVDINEDALD